MLYKRAQVWVCAYEGVREQNLRPSSLWPKVYLEMQLARKLVILAVCGLLGMVACDRGVDSDVAPSSTTAEEAAAKQGTPAHKPPKKSLDTAPMKMPVPLWENGKTARQIDADTAELNGYLVIDLGEAFIPYLFTDGKSQDGTELPNAYRETYLALAREEFPDNHHGERAERDKYLELYGIVPTLSVLRKRFVETTKLACAKDLDLQPLIDFEDVVTYQSNGAARKAAGDFAYLNNRVKKMMRKQKVEEPEQLVVGKLEDREQDILKRFFRQRPAYTAVRAMQQRLKCEGYFKTRGRYVKGGMDWPTHDALAEFERRHRVYSWGYIGKDSLAVLRISPMEADRESVLRVLTERAMLSAAVLEDGSTSTKADGSPRTFKGVDGKQHPIPNFESQLRQHLIEAFGLQTPESTLAFLESLGELKKDEHRLVAIPGIELPEYYDGDMDLTLIYDRGDVWYDFPYDEEGNELRQPVARRPRVTVFVKYNGQRIPLARYGTTIGGWRSEKIGDTVMWKYKDSPVGDRVWEQIVAAPVWLPPDSTPERDLLARRAKRRPGEPKYEVNYHETGPSYASAYGLVAAYHRKFIQKPDGRIIVGGDEGIRTHGSVDYMSIMRRHSHGCHRLHNHIAVRLMSFVLAHRPHHRMGLQPTAFFRDIEYEEEKYRMEIKQGGYVFQLEKPLKVTVLEGRIRSKRKTPMDVAVPKFDKEIGAYLMPDGGAVALRGEKLVSVPRPILDAGVPEGVSALWLDKKPPEQKRPAILNPLRQSLGLPQVKRR